MSRTATRRRRRRKSVESDPRFVLKVAIFAGMLLAGAGLIIELVVISP